MTNYNDGNWHGWNGGECPVHPETLVEFIALADGVPWFNNREAKYCVWRDGDTSIIAFRVVREYRKPREWWLCNGRVYDSRINADCASFGQGDEIIHVREVLE